jgi:drug/metabolite transporter (DMT)-like permease
MILPLSRHSAVRIGLLTSTALVAFAANSLLCRLALRPGLIDAASFTTLRLVSGALTLQLLLRARAERPLAEGGWGSALALFAYAAPFSFAYLRIEAGVGALLLFGAVQTTMLLAGFRAGERLSAGEGLGLALAVLGLCGLLVPGLSAPDPLGAALMLTAGAAWGVYSVHGKRAARPLLATASNFTRSVPLAVGVSLVTASQAHASWRGVALAVCSGALASGLGYSLWYAALSDLTSTRAAIVQLAVPVLAAAGGVLLLDEEVTLRLLGCGAAILAGVALAVLTRPAQGAAGS